MEKKRKLIKGANMDIEIGKRATVMLPDGTRLSTSPVVSYFIGFNSVVEIVTQNTVYTTVE